MCRGPGAGGIVAHSRSRRKPAGLELGAEVRQRNLKLGHRQSLCNPGVFPDPTPLSMCLSATPMLLRQLGDEGKPSSVLRHRPQGACEAVPESEAHSPRPEHWGTPSRDKHGGRQPRNVECELLPSKGTAHRGRVVLPRDNDKFPGPSPQRGWQAASLTGPGHSVSFAL